MLARLPLLIFGIPAVYYILVESPDIIKAILILALALLGQLELCKIFNLPTVKIPLNEWISSVLIIFATMYHSEFGLVASFAFCSAFIMLSVVLKGLEHKPFQRFMASLFSIFYLPFCLSFYLLIAQSSGSLTLFMIIFSVWSLDIGAYLFGITLKGPKLAPKISPKKTISGAIGGTLSSIAFIHISSYYGLLDLSTLKLWLLSLTVPLVGQTSDLFESIIKREYQVKDSGNLLGAHGGILDRIDSLLFLAPLCYAIIKI